MEQYYLCFVLTTLFLFYISFWYSSSIKNCWLFVWNFEYLRSVYLESLRYCIYTLRHHIICLPKYHIRPLLLKRKSRKRSNLITKACKIFVVGKKVVKRYSNIYE